jgi:hypothetical protein
MLEQWRKRSGESVLISDDVLATAQLCRALYVCNAWSRKLPGVLFRPVEKYRPGNIPGALSCSCCGAGQRQNIEDASCDALNGSNNIRARPGATQHADIESTGIGILPAFWQYLHARKHR